MGNDIFSDGLIREIYWQPIVDRHGHPVGYECLIRLAGIADQNTDRAFSTMSTGTLNKVVSELLFRLRLKCLFIHNDKNQPPLKIFLNIEKEFFLCQDAVSELIDSSVFFKNSGYELVVEITERPLRMNSSFRKYVDGLVRLSNEKISLVLDDYPINNDENIELELGLINIVKFEIETLGLPAGKLSPDFMANQYNKLRDTLYDFLQAYKVNLLAEKVENSLQLEVLCGLPFRYYQGFYFGRPNTAENGVIPISSNTGKSSLPSIKILRANNNLTLSGPIEASGFHNDTSSTAAALSP